MIFKRTAAIIYAVASMGVLLFQVALALGAPWGAYAMGGAYPGQFPPAMRVAALVQALLLLLMAGIVLSRGGVALRRWSRISRWLIWVVVAFAAVSFVLNLITPSAGERMLWAPVAFVLFGSSLVVGLRDR
ncbi:MAG: hypothetical protein H6645_13885 [Caldilineaceae bacterium]|nr:hypothetical protein [Caldilineaceae bacterium]